MPARFKRLSMLDIAAAVFAVFAIWMAGQVPSPEIAWVVAILTLTIFLFAFEVVGVDVAEESLALACELISRDSTTPADADIDVSAVGAILVKFDEKIELAKREERTQIVAPGKKVESRTVDLVVPLVAGDRWVLGRGKECQVTLDNPTISRQHAEITRQGPQLVLRDLADDMAELCPNALLLNYANPMAANCRTWPRRSSFPRSPRGTCSTTTAWSCLD